jgi:YD repeat-containing protein
MYVEEEPNDRVIEAEHRKYHEVHPEIFKPERIDLLQQNASLSVNDLYPTINTTIDGLAYVYIQAAASPPHDGEFTIPSGATENETTTVVIAANFKQTVNNSPGFDFTIYTQQTNVVYTVNIQSWHMKMIGNNYVYDETVEIELPPGDYVAKLSGYSTDSNVHYDGNFCISFSKQTSTMVPQYSLFKPEIYYQYDTKGNVIEFKPAGSNVPTTYLWGYKYQYPIAKIENATYEQVRTALTDQAAVDAIANSDTLLNTQLDALNNLRTNPSLPNAMVTTYTYKPLVGLQTVTDPRGVTITYEYDSFGRLQAIKDENGKTIENYNYHYKN